MQIQTGHTNEENAFVVNDYPYGFTLRTSIRYWVETREGQGQRFCSQTLNPKTNKWNAPKKSTYSKLILLGINPVNNHLERVDIPDGINTTVEDLANWYKLYYKFLDLFQLKAFAFEYANRLAHDAIKDSIKLETNNFAEYRKAVILEFVKQNNRIKEIGLDKLIGVE